MKSFDQIKSGCKVYGALLVILGFSIHDTIVVFDRVRENFKTLHKLSPFEVMSDTKGYYSSNTMSGTRFNSKLEDLGSSITVVTKQQMEDTAVLDLNELVRVVRDARVVRDQVVMKAPQVIVRWLGHVGKFLAHMAR